VRWCDSGGVSPPVVAELVRRCWWFNGWIADI